MNIIECVRQHFRDLVVQNLDTDISLVRSCMTTDTGPAYLEMKVRGVYVKLVLDDGVATVEIKQFPNRSGRYEFCHPQFPDNLRDALLRLAKEVQ